MHLVRRMRRTATKLMTNFCRTVRQELPYLTLVLNLVGSLNVALMLYLISVISSAPEKFDI